MAILSGESTYPNGMGDKCGLEDAQDEGTPLPLRPARAAANDASRKFTESTYPADYADKGRVDMKARTNPCA